MSKYLIDCRAFINEGSSISVYLYNLLTEILKNDKKNEYILVLNNKEYIPKFDKSKNIKIIYSKVKNNILWDNFVIPYYAIKTNSSLIFYPKGSTCWFRIPRKKIIVTIHGMIYKIQPEIHSKLENFYWRIVGKIASLVSNRIIVVSNRDKTDLISEGYNPKKMQIIPIGLSSTFLEKYPQEKVNDTLKKYELSKKKYLIQVGHLTKKKNQEFTLNLYNNLVKKYPNLKLVFVGGDSTDKEYANKLVLLIKKFGLKGRIIFTGAIDQNKSKEIIPILLRNSSLFIFPSTYEGFGMPPVEAIGSKTPVLSSNKGSLPEVLGKENILELELSLWIDEATKILKDKDYRNTLIIRQSKLIEKYKWSEISKIYIRILKEECKK